jgi:tryptophan synthase beta chain
MEAFFLLCRNEGIIPAVESSHRAGIRHPVRAFQRKGSLLVNLSGRGDKDIDYISNTTAPANSSLNKGVLRSKKRTV